MRIAFIVLFFFCFNISLHSQIIKSSKSRLEHTLSKQYNQKITLEKVEVYNSPQNVRPFGVFSKTISVPFPGVVITFIVPKDTSGAKYRRIAYFPFTLFEKKSNLYYYQDHCLGGGSHFDSQGGSSTIGQSAQTIINQIEYSPVHAK